MMNAQQGLLDQLEDGLASNDIGHRAKTLWRVTDLFVTGSHRFSDEQIALFDDVMCRFLAQIEISALATFGRRLATIPKAPPKVIRALALNDAIDVAGPVLSLSERLDEITLVESAKTKSQSHLLAISRRKTLAEAVTDVLVERGNQQVAASTARNAGATFSEFGYAQLVQRSQHDSNLALCVWSRPEMPRQHLLQLFADASEAVRHQFETTDPRKGDLIRAAVAEASNRVQAIAREDSPRYAQALSYVRSLHESDELDESHLAAFAGAGKFDETAIALSIMCDLPIAVMERLMVQSRSEQILVLAKAIGLSWATTKAILLLQAGTNGSPAHELDRCFASFTRLRPETAKKAITFYRLRERAAAPSSSDKPLRHESVAATGQK